MSSVQSSVTLIPITAGSVISIGASFSENALKRFTEQERVWLSQTQATVRYAKVGEQFRSNTLSTVSLGGSVYLFCTTQKVLIRYIGSKQPDATGWYAFLGVEKPHPNPAPEYKDRKITVWE